MASERMRHLMGVARSAAWIAGIQAVNFLIPLAALPFIVRGLGVEQFSVYAVLMACATFLVVFADFSFNVTGPLRVRAAVAEGRLGTLVLDSMVLKGGLIVPGAVVFLAGALTLGGAGVLDATLALAFAVTVTMTPRWVVYSLGRLRAFALISAVEPARVARGGGLAGARAGGPVVPARGVGGGAGGHPGGVLCAGLAPGGAA